MMTVSRRPTAKIAALAALLLLPLGASSLEREGPIDGSNGFPLWYQDDTGITLDLCLPRDAAEAAWCAVPDVPPLGFPETFPSNWVGEHFYWTATAIADTATTDALLVLGIESTFSSAEPIDGNQITFGRLRVRVGRKDNNLLPVLHRVYTPYGTFDVVAEGGELNFTNDIDVLVSDIDRYLIPADAPGGNELAPVTFNGRKFLRNPADPLPFVTGSTRGTYTLMNGSTRNANIFLIERRTDGAIIAETYLFDVAGRVFDGVVRADAKAERANFARDASGNRIDVYATGHAALPIRDPAGDPVTATPPTIALYTLPCDGPENGPYSAPAQAPVPFARNGSVYWAEAVNTVLNETVCVSFNLPGSGTTFESVPLVDQVFVTKAHYTPASRTLVVEAASADVVDSALRVARFGDTEEVDLTNGVASIVMPAGAAAPPSVVQVLSTQGGLGEAEVTLVESSVLPPATGVSLSANVPSPQDPGTAVTFTAQGQGSSNYQYRFWLRTGDTWAVVQDYSATNTWTLPSSTPSGNYAVSVWVRTNPTSDRDAETVISYEIRAALPPATGVTLFTNVPSPQTLGTPVIFAAQGQGSSDYEYRFWLRTGDVWAVVQDYSPSGTWTLPSTTAAGDYTVSVWVRTSPNSDRDAEALMPFSIGDVAVPATGLLVTTDLPSPQTPGTPVTFTADGQGSANYQYRFWLRTGDTWAVVQDYSGDNTWTASLPAGTYLVSVWVRTSGTVSKDFETIVPFVIE